MKTIYIIGGTMGVGKTTVCRKMRDILQPSVFLDGDWCWDMNPFEPTEMSKRMVVDNICYLLNNFIRCPDFEYIIFGWVLHVQSLIDEIALRLDLDGCRFVCVSLVCSRDALSARLSRDISLGLRSLDIIERSIARLPMYGDLRTYKLDVSDISADEAAQRIIDGRFNE